MQLEVCGENDSEIVDVPSIQRFDDNVVGMRVWPPIVGFCGCFGEFGSQLFFESQFVIILRELSWLK